MAEMTREEFMEIIYPVGWIHESYQDIDPGELMGFGEWVRIGETVRGTFFWKRVR